MMRARMRGFGVVVGVMAAALGGAATMPGVDYSSPRGVYRSYQGMVLAGEPEALEKCSVAPVSDDEKNAFNVENANNGRIALAIALRERFGAPAIVPYDNGLPQAGSMMSRIDGAEERIEGENGELLVPVEWRGRSGAVSPIKIEFRKSGEKWRMVVPAAHLAEESQGYQAALGPFYFKTTADLKSGAIPTFLAFQKRMASFESEQALARRIKPVYEAPALDPQGLRVSVEPVEARASDDGAFHVELVLKNTGSKALNLLMGKALRSDRSLLVPNSQIYMEAVDHEGLIHTVAMIDGYGYSGPPPMPWVVTLEPGKTYRLRPQMGMGGPRKMAAGWNRGRGEATISKSSYLLPGSYEFKATFMSNQVHEKYQPGDLYFSWDGKVPEAARMEIWTGTVVSGVVKVEVPAAR
jgi:hypothetical protein